MANAKILVVEDERIVGMEIQSILKNLGYSVPDVLPSGEEAIQKAPEIRPDLVLMDIKLKGELDGVEAARKIRALFDIPVVYLTAYADSGILQRAKITEPYGYILKPFQKRELHAVIEMALHKHKMEKALQISHRCLKIANRCTEMDFLLREFVKEIRKFTGYSAVGICLLEEDNISYKAYEGLSDEFYDSENHLSIKSDKCMCVKVIKGEIDAKLPFYTEGGSFYLNNTTHFLTTLSDEEKGQMCDVCNQFGYESVASVPIRLGNQILGLIHIVDSQKNSIPLETVEVLEDIGMQLADAITRVWSEESLRKSEEKYRTLFEESKDVVFITTPEGKFVDINSAGVELFGYPSKEELLNVDITRELYIEPSARKVYQEIIAQQGFVKDYELLLKRKDGQRVIVLVTTDVVRDDKGNIAAYRGIMRDVTGRKRLEQQLLQSQKMASLGVMAGGVAHEINNPLNVISGTTQLLEKRYPDEFAQKSIKVIRDAVSRASKVVRNLSDFARRKPQTSFELLSINQVVEAALSMFEYQLERSRIKVDKHLADDLPFILGDANQLQQVIVNLILNAKSAMQKATDDFVLPQKTTATKVKATDDLVSIHSSGDFDTPFGHSIQAQPKVRAKSISGYSSQKGGKLTLKTMHMNDQVVIECSDTGEGISPDDLGKLFDPFYTTRPPGEGTGLGLSINYHIIQQHGGVIEAYSPGKNCGSTFTIKLPAYKQKPENNVQK